MGIITWIFQMMKLQPKEVKWLAQGHKVRNRNQIRVSDSKVLFFLLVYRVYRKLVGLHLQIVIPNSAWSSSLKGVLKQWQYPTWEHPTVTNWSYIMTQCTHTHIYVCVRVYLSCNNIHLYSDGLYSFVLSLFKICLCSPCWFDYSTC